VRDGTVLRIDAIVDGHVRRVPRCLIEQLSLSVRSGPSPAHHFRTCSDPSVDHPKSAGSGDEADSGKTTLDAVAGSRLKRHTVVGLD
jgi:hypothetical protein